MWSAAACRRFSAGTTCRPGSTASSGASCRRDARVIAELSVGKPSRSALLGLSDKSPHSIARAESSVTSFDLKRDLFPVALSRNYLPRLACNEYHVDRHADLQ